MQAVVLSNINILRDSSGLEVNGADICYCCEVVRDILERVIANLDSFRVIVASDFEPFVHLDAMALAHIVSAARHQLFRVQAVMRALALVLQSVTQDSYEATLRVVFVALGELMEEAITKLEPMNLGLPTPEVE